MGLLGWVLRWEALKRPLSHGVTMKVNVAVCLMLTGCALTLLRGGGTRRGVQVGRATAAVAMLLGAATLCEQLFGWNLWIDQLLFTEAPGALATASPNRMGLPDSVSFTVCGAALLLLDVRTRRDRVPSQYLAIFIGLLAIMSLIGYAYSVQPLYALSHWTAIAAHTSLALAALSIGLLCARPERGMMALVTAEGPAGILARRMLLAAIAFPFALGWSRALAETHGVIDPMFGRPLLILAIIVVFTGLGWWNANLLARMDAERARTDEQRRLAEELARKQQEDIVHLSRINTVGEMAAGLAHELNQPLGAIVNYAGVATDAISRAEHPPHNVAEALEQISCESRRAGDIVRRLRDFVRKRRQKIVPVDVNDLIRESVRLLAADFRHAGVRCQLELAASLPPALADGVQIEQVLVNLLRNAVDAMSQSPAAERQLLVKSDVADAALRVKVIDRGCGADADVRRSMFDAFFTTKPEGMGMGLAISRSIIEGHSGHIQAIANPDAGLTIEFTLPIAK